MPSSRRVVVPEDTSWQELARGQAGVLSRQQALAAGLTRHQWQRQLTTGRWQALLHGVAVTHSGGVDDEQRAWAAVLYAGTGAALTGDAALRLQGMTLDAPRVWRTAVPEVLVLAPQRGADRSLQVQTHRVVGLEQLVHPTRTPPVVRPAPALLHAAAWAPTARAAEWRVAAAVQQRVVTPQQVRDALTVSRRTARRALVATVLDDVELGAHARSELDLLAFLRAHGLPLPDRLQLAVRTQTGLRYVDAWYERPRVAVELDGAHHRTVQAWESDLARSNELAVLRRDERALLLRLTPGHLRHDAAATAALLQRALLLPVTAAA